MRGVKVSSVNICKHVSYIIAFKRDQLSDSARLKPPEHGLGINIGKNQNYP